MEEKTKMKLCINCRFSLENGTYCFHSKINAISLIDGKLDENNWKTASRLQREDDFLESLMLGTCGKRGRWFKPKI